MHEITLDPDIGLRQVYSLDSQSLADEGARGAFQQAIWMPDDQAVLLTYRQMSEVDLEDEDIDVKQVSSAPDEVAVTKADMTSNWMQCPVGWA